MVQIPTSGSQANSSQAKRTTAARPAATRPAAPVQQLAMPPAVAQMPPATLGAEFFGEDRPAAAQSIAVVPAASEPDVDQVAEIECPLTHEIFAPDDIDAMIDCLERCKAASNLLYDMQTKLRIALAARTEGDAKTRRVQGRRRKAKIEMPGDGWEQSVLKEAFNAYPQYRDEVLKIDTIGVRLREFKKLVNTSGPDDFVAFRDMVTRANKGPCGNPTVTIEV